MIDMQNQAPNRSALVYRFYERIYRLALLLVGDADAAERLVERTYRELPAAATNPEASLVRGLLAGRPSRRRRWSPDAAMLDRATLDREHAAALQALLARLTPVARLTIGLSYLAGSSPDEIADLLGASAGDQPVADLLSRFRADAARAIGFVPADADADAVARLERSMSGLLSEEESLALRRELFEQPDLRDLRDAVSNTRERLQRAIPALYAVAAPAGLADRLLQIVAGPPQRIRAPHSNRRAQGLLALGVLALAAVIVLAPSLMARRNAATTAGSREPTAAELIDAAIHRFDRAPLDTGVLHEQYRIAQDEGQAYVVERWYDYATPHRLAISAGVEGANTPPLLQIGSDGHSLVQFRGRGESGPRRMSFDATMTEAEAQAVLPLLRSQPQASAFASAPNNVADPGPLYLAQARASGASFLGQATALGRPAYLLTYRTAELPGQPTADQMTRVILTVDAQTKALLDVALLAEGAAEATTRHPLAAQQFEVLASVPDERFRLRSSSRVAQRDGIASVRFPFIDGGQLLSLDDAAREAAQPILAPRELPDAQMRGLAISVGGGSTSAQRSVALLYEGEFQDVIVMPNSTAGSPSNPTGDERSAGNYRYRILGEFDGAGGVSALVFPPDTAEQPMTVMLNAGFATAAEREQMLEGIIASLTPVDAESLPVLRRNFQTPSAAAGKS